MASSPDFANFCAQNQTRSPKFHIYQLEKEKFICQIILRGVESIGSGRSASEAKLMSELLYMKKMEQGDDSGLQETPDAATTKANPSIFDQLSDYCVKNKMSLPDIKIFGPRDLKYAAICKLGSITHFANSDDENDARNKVAIAMFESISSIQKIKNLMNKMISEAKVNVSAKDQATDEIN